MSDKKNIERLFQEKFKDFEVAPPEIVWDNIEKELKKKNSKKVMPLWLRLSGVAALLLIGFIVGDGLLNNVSEKTNVIVNQEDSEISNERSDELVPMENPIKSNQIVTESGESQNQEFGSKKENDSSEKVELQNSLERDNSVVHKQSGKISSSQTRAIASQNSDSFDSNKATNRDVEANDKKEGNTSEHINKTQTPENTTVKNNALANQEKENRDKENQKDSFEKSNQRTNTLSNKINPKTQVALNTKELEKQKIDSTGVATVEPNPLEELLKEKENQEKAVTETKVNRWQITSNVAPIYFSSASNGSPVDPQFADNSKDYEKNLSYGVGVNYALGKKWSVRSGINKLTLGYNTNDIVYHADLNARSGAQNYKSTGIVLEDNSAINVLSFDNVSGKIPGYLNQTMGYIEVPVELSYKLLDRKFGIEIIGGMSTMFLNENNLSVVSNGMSTSLGGATNLNDVSFTSNIGLGFKYKFWKSFQANIEPKFKYQINTFSENAGGFKPYFIGLYSGISFSF